jgi:hypothetical protein
VESGRASYNSDGKSNALSAKHFNSRAAQSNKMLRDECGVWKSLDKYYPCTVRGVKAFCAESSRTQVSLYKHIPAMAS